MVGLHGLLGLLLYAFSGCATVPKQIGQMLALGTIGLGKFCGPVRKTLVVILKLQCLLVSEL